jgi:hypothetical protein
MFCKSLSLCVLFDKPTVLLYGIEMLLKRKEEFFEEQLLFSKIFCILPAGQMVLLNAYHFLKFLCPLTLIISNIYFIITLKKPVKSVLYNCQKSKSKIEKNTLYMTIYFSSFTL